MVIRLSTYKKIMRTLSPKLLTYKFGSYIQCLKPLFKKYARILSYQDLDACLRPYKFLYFAY